MSKPQRWTPQHSIWAKLPPKPKVRPEYETILNYDIRQYNYIPQSDKRFLPIRSHLKGIMGRRSLKTKPPNIVWRIQARRRRLFSEHYKEYLL